MNTVNKKEIDKFSKLAEEWWNPFGKFKPLHKLNPIRVEVIRNKIISYYNLKNENQSLGLTKKRVNLYIKDVKEFGLLRKQVVFASLRYQRWIDLNKNATYEARGEIILDLYKDYNLRDLTLVEPLLRNYLQQHHSPSFHHNLNISNQP